ncbi:MAG: class I SAM-dependent methyltransferase [Candidatus Melainabacteria bacterium]|nr:class I SAM-dependent methyltransferase [Candidatus Melainabacteria bacterium]
MKICLYCSFEFENDNWVCPSCNEKPLNQEGRLIFSPSLSERNNGFEVEFFERLFKVEERNFWFCGRNKLLIWAIKKYFPGANSLFEIGCGTGFVLSGIEKQFPGLDLYGSEIFNSGLDFAQRRLSRVRLMQMDATKIPFKEEFDVIGAFDVLEHIESDQLVLKEMYKSVRKGGGIILTVPHHDFLWSKIDEIGHHVRRYSANSLKNKVKEAGFNIIKVTSFVSLLLPLFMLSRLRWKNTTGMCDNISELRINKSVNCFLERILDIERLIIKLGITFPFGSSLLLIGQKVN